MIISLCTTSVFVLVLSKQLNDYKMK